jgi:diadenosine tetraphosphate (Ap4A) HIT family hydrolase
MANVRGPDQLAEMQRLEDAGICLFCPDGLRGHSRNAVVHRTAHWSVTPNAFPYPGTRLHLLLVPHQHAGDLLDLDPDARADFWTTLAWVRDSYGLSYYGLGVRNGDCRYTGATITHVHAHVLVGDPDTQVPVRFRFSG